MKSHQKGFSVVEILIVFVVVGLLGAVGWLVYDRQKSQTDTADLSEQTNQQQTTATPTQAVSSDTIPEGWKMYDANPYFSFAYPSEWEAIIKVSEYPVSEAFTIRYIGEVKLNETLDGWVHTTTENGATVGAKADVVLEEGNKTLLVWRFGFGDAGYSSLVPTFVANGKVYQIATGSSCPEKTADCMAATEYLQAYEKLVASIKLR